MHRSAFQYLLLVFLTLSAFPAAGQDPAASFDAPYELLDLSETETGVLANRRSVYLDPGRFQGTTAADTLRPLQWEVLFGQLRMSAADPSDFPSPTALATLAHDEREAGRLPIALLYQPFDYISEAPLQDGRLEVDDSGPVQQVYRPTVGVGSRTAYAMPPPYEQASAFAAGVLYGAEMTNARLGPVEVGATATFSVPSGLFVVPAGTGTPSTVDVDPGDGGGYRTVSVGQTVSAAYGTPGEKTVQVRASVAGSVRHARFALRVRESTSGGAGQNLVGRSSGEACAEGAVGSHWSSVHCGVEPDPQLAWSGARNYPNVLSRYDGTNRTAKYDYAVSLAPGHTHITNPIIVVSGYDPFEDTTLDKLYEKIRRYRDEFTVGPFVDLPQALKAEDYDIVVMDYADSQDFIQRNGLALVDLIQRIHAEMDDNPDSDGEIGAVIGLSMGGLVSRYALAYMEEEMNVDHRVGLFVSYDSPQQGAYSTAGLSMAFADFYGIADGVLDILPFLELIPSVGDGVDFIEQRLYGAAAQQLSTFWAGLDLGASSPSAVQTQIRRDLYADLIALGDYPDDLRLVAVSNGNGDGRGQHLNPVWNTPSAPLMQPRASTLYFEAGYSTLWGIKGKSIRMRMRNAGPAGVATQVYRRWHRTCFIFCDNDTDAQSTLTLRNAYDTVPGGYQPTWSLLKNREIDIDTRDNIFGFFASIWLGASASVELSIYASRHAFVPTVSALDYRTNSYSSRDALLDATFLNQDLGASITQASRTPFDAFYVAGGYGDAAPNAIGSESQGHLFISNGIKTFILEQLAWTPPPLQPLSAHISGPTSLAVNETGYWNSNAHHGQPPYSYKWFERYVYYPDPCNPPPCNATACTESTRGPICEEFRLASTSHRLAKRFNPGGNVLIALEVTDASGARHRDLHHVNVGGGNRPAGDAEAQALQEAAELEADKLDAAASSTVPDEVTLSAFPNPFASATAVRFGVPERAEVRLAVYDVLGREVAVLADGSVGAGWHTARLAAESLPSGVYVVRLTAGSFVQTQRVTLVR